MLQNVMADRMHQVGLAQTDAPVQEQRVVCFGRRFRHRERCGMGEAVVRADDERIECIFGVEHGRSRLILNGRAGRRTLWLRNVRFRMSRLFDDELDVHLIARNF